MNKEFVKDETFWIWVEEVDPDCNLTEKELVEIYKTTFPEETE